jgi:hypothetical protein
MPPKTTQDYGGGYMVGRQSNQKPPSASTGESEASDSDTAAHADHALKAPLLLHSITQLAAAAQERSRLNHEQLTDDLAKVVQDASTLAKVAQEEGPARKRKRNRTATEGPAAEVSPKPLEQQVAKRGPTGTPPLADPPSGSE